MAASSWTVYGPAKARLLTADIDLNVANHLRMILVGSGYTPNANTHGLYSDVSANELTTTGGYTVGGQSLGTATVTDGGAGTITVDWGDITWTTATFTAKYAVIVQDADSNGTLVAGDFLLGYAQLETGGAGTVTVNNGTLAVNTANAFTLA